jgi:hypothetical protein
MWSSVKTILPLVLTTYSLIAGMPISSQAESTGNHFNPEGELRSQVVDTSLDIDLQYVPPNRGTPARRGGGGTR